MEQFLSAPAVSVTPLHLGQDMGRPSCRKWAAKLSFHHEGGGGCAVAPNCTFIYGSPQLLDKLYFSKYSTFNDLFSADKLPF